MALKTTCIKNVRFKIIEISTGSHCRYVGYFYYNENLKLSCRLYKTSLVLAACSPRVGHNCPKPDPRLLT